MSTIERVWTKVKSWWEHDATHLTYLFFPAGGESPQPYRSYLRLWLSEMFLAQDRQKATDRQPAVQASVRLAFAGTSAVTFSTLTRPPKSKQLGPGVRRDVKLTELVPYSGGTVELQAALLDVEGVSDLRIAVDVIQDFSSLLAPPLGMALTIAEKVAGGIAKVDDALDGPILAFDETFAAAGAPVGNIVHPGYHVVIRAKEGTFAPGSLQAPSGRLQRTADGSALVGHDYFVLGVEARAERDDWRFPAWDALIGHAIAAQIHGNADEFERLKTEVLSQVFTSPDLTPTDRKRVARLVSAELAADLLGGVGEERLETVSELVSQRGLPDASQVGELTLAELLA